MTAKSHSGRVRERASRSRARPSSKPSGPREPKRVLIVDDHGFYANGLSSLINNESDILVCGTCAKLSDVVDSVEETKPDLVILDVSVAGENSVELANTLREMQPELKFMFLSSFPGGIVHSHGKHLNPNSVVEKTQDPESILKAIRRAIRS